MQRFFAGNLIGRTDVDRFVFSVFGWQNVRLTLDRTTWEYGKSCINILVRAVVWRGVAIPVLWETLDKRGTPIVWRFLNVHKLLPLALLISA